MRHIAHLNNIYHHIHINSVQERHEGYTYKNYLNNKSGGHIKQTSVLTASGPSEQT